MRINGEAFLAINGWMNYLSLFLAARLGKARFRPLRAALGALAGAVWAVPAWEMPKLLGSVPALLGAALVMALIAFGRRAPSLWILVMISGLLLSGCASFLRRQGLNAGWTLSSCAAMAWLLCRERQRLVPAHSGRCRVIITWRGRTVCLPALRDSGNLLRDGVTGLPVIAVAEKLLFPLLPPGTAGADPLSLPAGFRLLPMQTASGKCLAVCFHPQEIWLVRGNKKWPADALVALTKEDMPRALLPECLFDQEEERKNATL